MNNVNLSYYFASYFLFVPDIFSPQIFIQFISFSLEDTYDYLHIYETDSSDQRSGSLIGSFTGTTRPHDVISTHPTVRLEFVSDYSVQYTGFFIEISQVNNTGMFFTKLGF